MIGWKSTIGETIKDDRRNLTITDREIRYMSNQKKPYHQRWIKYTCNVCGWTEGWAPEKTIYNEGKGCSCCKGKVVVPGINDIATKAPYVIPYLLDPEDAHKYTPSSGNFVKTKCILCGDIRDYRVAQLTTAPYVCHRCGRNTSTPEKFFYEFFKMYNIEFIYQLSSKKMKWCNKYRYDFYIPSKNMIIELHGRQHYKLGIYHRTYESIHETDEQKIKLAMVNGISIYICIGVPRSEKNELINSILSSNIADWLEINKANLKENLEICYEKVFTKKMKEICDYYTKHPDLSAIAIGEACGVTSPTVLRALHEGTELGLCYYDGRGKLLNTLKKIKEKEAKPIEITSPNGDLITFPSIREAERMSKSVLGKTYTRFFINKHCRSGQALDGYRFRYVEKN